MQPQENGPWRKNQRRNERRAELRYVPIEDMIAAAEALLRESARLAREVGEELFPMSLCTNTLCSFAAAGDWIHCPNGHPVVCGELTEGSRNNVLANWN